MADQSAIEWTDATWNPTTGCTKISPGCARCYIERTPAFRIAGRKFVTGHIPLQLHQDRIEQPLHWRKPRRVFVNSLSDLFHDDVPDDFIDQVFAVMALASQHSFQVLTKRPRRMHDYVNSRFLPNWPTPDVVWPLPNVWLGVSVENQRFADDRIPQLLQTPAAMRFISAEPLLGPVDLTRIALGQRVTFGFGSRWIEWDALTGWERQAHTGGRPEAWHCRAHDSISGNHPTLDWVIVGGESGPGARSMERQWARSLRDQCLDAGVEYFFKQWGGPTAKSGGRQLDGREWNDVPEARL